MKTRLNLGCDDKILDGFINIDIVRGKGVKVMDLNKFPYDFKENSVDYCLCSHVLEHLDDPIAVLLELHRICKPDVIIDVYVPHFSHFTFHIGFTHKNSFSYFTFGEKEFNKVVYDKFKVKRKLNFNRINYRWMNYIFNPIINLFPLVYERFFCYVLPASEIHFQLKVIKKNEV